MRPARIDQVVPSFGGRDAIGVHVLHVRELLRDLGYRSDIWCRGAFPEVRGECRLLDELPGRPLHGTWWLYHLSSGSPAADVIGARSEPVMVDYHNITPASFFEPWVPWAVESAHQGRRQLAELADGAFFAMADSRYNDDELRGAGFRRSVVVPPLFDHDALGLGADHETLAHRRAERAGGGADWLFVGRIAPSKAQHDLVKAFVCYRRWHDPAARLHLVGTGLGDAYPAAMRRFAESLGVADAVRMPGAVSEGVLGAHYATADVFVSASEHEGFCIPLVEAMQAGVPVVAYDAGAVAETAGAGALVLPDKSPMVLAEAVHRVLTDQELRARLVSAGRARSRDFTLDRGRARWEAALAEALVAHSTAGPVAP
ncbi:MAG: glycosyltransferase family 4 protein [Acidimicrobiales bacterium]